MCKQHIISIEQWAFFPGDTLDWQFFFYCFFCFFAVQQSLIGHINNYDLWLDICVLKEDMFLSSRTRILSIVGWDRSIVNVQVIYVCHCLGLFSRAIMQSGSTLNPWAQTRSHGSHARYVASSLGCPLQEGSEAFLACLQAVDARELAALAQNLLVSYWVCTVSLVSMTDSFSYQ